MASRKTSHTNYTGNVATGDARVLNGNAYNIDRKTVTYSFGPPRLGAKRKHRPKDPVYPPPPEINCSKCSAKNIASVLHYHCWQCNYGQGDFNLCLQCYRGERGCYESAPVRRAIYARMEAEHKMKLEHEPVYTDAGDDEPHTLTARKYVRTLDSAALRDQIHQRRNPTTELGWELLEGAFCENCFQHCDEKYWHCRLCFGGAWGFCASCVGKGLHCTHALYPVAHEDVFEARVHRNLPQEAFADVPHLSGTYCGVSAEYTCDDCHRLIVPEEKRHHCYQCNDGNFDLCEECFDRMYSRKSMPRSWKRARRCLEGHRMAVVDYITLQYKTRKSRVYECHVRFTVAKPVGGKRKLDGESFRCAAVHSWFPRKSQGYKDVLEFPRGAEIQEVTEVDGEWLEGVYCGKVGKFPVRYINPREKHPLEEGLTGGRITEI